MAQIITMRPSKIISNLLFLVIAVVLLYFGYQYLAKPAAPVAGGLTADGFTRGEGEGSASDEFLETLTDLQDLNLDGSVFQHPVFQHLQDSTIIIPDQAPGRFNPFAPVNFSSPRALGTSASTTSSTGASTANAPRPSGSAAGSAPATVTTPSGTPGLQDLRAR